MLTTQKTFDLEYTITDDWGGSHRVAIDVEALSAAEDWKIGVSLPDDYRIDQIYGGELSQEDGKTYVSGTTWNKDLSQGSMTKIVFIVDEGNSGDSEPVLPEFFFAESSISSELADDSVSDNSDNSEQTSSDNNSNLNFDSQIVEDWYGGYKLQLDITADGDAENWQADFTFPYTIREVYGVDLIDRGDGNYTISGQNDLASLQSGESIEPIFIIDSGEQPASFPDFTNTNTESAPQQQVDTDTPTESAPETNNQISASPSITEDWEGGYKLEMTLEAETNIDNWEVDFALPYSIREAYGVEIIDRGNGTYTINGQNSLSDLQSGQSINAIFIVDDNGEQAVVPESISSDSGMTVTEDTNDTDADSSPTFEVSDDSDSDPTSEVSDDVDSDSDPTSEVSDDADTDSDPTSEASDDVDTDSDPTSEVSESDQNTSQPDGDGKTLNVDNDFGGDLESAIAAANNGDVVQLGGNVYFTDGITISKDITVDGQQGSVVNGNGTSNSIFYLDAGASGATIQDLEVTNANIGIRGEGATNLTLQNLNVNNIGIDQTIRSGPANSGILLGRADGSKILNSDISNIGRKGVGVGDTDGATISGISVQNVNLQAQHAQSHDAAGIKFFNTNNIVLTDSYFAKINAMHIWNDTTNGTQILNNVVENAGDSFAAPSFNKNVGISGIYNEKSSNSVVKNNKATSVGNFAAYKATKFTTETMTMEGNDFSSSEINTQDFWVNESAEKLIATTEDPAEANFNLFADEYFAQANIG